MSTLYGAVNSTSFNGILYTTLPPASYDPAGDLQGEPFWLFGPNGETKIFGLKELPNRGGLAGVTINGIPWSAGFGIEPYSPHGDEQMIPYIDPSAAMLDALPLSGDLTGKASDMIFEGELALPGFSAGASSPVSSASISSTPLSSASAASPFGVNPWF